MPTYKFGGKVAGGYPTGWSKEIYINWEETPQLGQLVAFGRNGTLQVYTVIEVCDQTTLLDRPLEFELVNGHNTLVGPMGNFNFIFPPSLSLVSRPINPYLLFVPCWLAGPLNFFTLT
jgi:hypothetical protein